jgi:predicted amidohydrolase
VLRIAACQLPLNIETPETNLLIAEAAIREAAGLGAELVVLPELTNSGYVFRTIDEVSDRATQLDGPIVRQWSALARELKVTIVGGLAIDEGGKFFNTSVIVDESGLRGSYKKVHFWNDEPDFFTPGADEPLVVDCLLRLGVSGVGAIGTLGRRGGISDTNQLAGRRPLY